MCDSQKRSPPTHGKCGLAITRPPPLVASSPPMPRPFEPGSEISSPRFASVSATACQVAVVAALRARGWPAGGLAVEKRAARGAAPAFRSSLYISRHTSIDLIGRTHFAPAQRGSVNPLGPPMLARYLSYPAAKPAASSLACA